MPLADLEGGLALGRGARRHLRGHRGTAGRWARTRSLDVDAVLVEVESDVEPRSWFSVSLATGERTLVKRVEVPTYDPSRYLVDRIEVTARDGVSIPVTVVRRDDTPLDGSAPALLYGYGAYESAWWPGIEPALASLLDAGVVYVHAHIRGGGERGRRWWLEGCLSAKVHTFDDFVDVADALDADGIVDGARIVSRGLSAGGLLQGAVFSMRPDRWRAVVAEVPFVDVVTTMFDADLPLTAGEWDEWGDPRKPEEFAWLMAYSPYDNVPEGHRPALLVTGALNDLAGLGARAGQVGGQAAGDGSAAGRGRGPGPSGRGAPAGGTRGGIPRRGGRSLRGPRRGGADAGRDPRGDGDQRVAGAAAQRRARDGDAARVGAGADPARSTTRSASARVSPSAPGGTGRRSRLGRGPRSGRGAPRRRS